MKQKDSKGEDVNVINITKCIRYVARLHMPTCLRAYFFIHVISRQINVHTVHARIRKNCVTELNMHHLKLALSPAVKPTTPVFYPWTNYMIITWNYRAC